MTGFAERLKGARELSGLTQEQLAQKVGVTRQAVSRWEQGITQPDIEMLATLGQVLQVDAENLAFGKHTEKYQRFQKRYIGCTAGAFGFAAIVLLLGIFLAPYLKALVNTYDFSSFLYFWLFRLLLPPTGYFALGFGSASFVTLFYNTGLNRRWRITALISGLVTIAPSLLVVIDDLLAVCIDGYSAHIAFALYVRTSLFPSVQTLLYTILPILSGALCFLGTNKK